MQCDPVGCDEVAKALPRLLDTARRADRPMTRHVETCLRCQAELAKYRAMLRLLEQLRAEHPPLPEGALPSVLAALDQRAGDDDAVRSALGGRRVVLVGGVAVAAVGATAATVALAVGRGRSARSARAS